MGSDPQAVFRLRKPSVPKLLVPANLKPGHSNCPASRCLFWFPTLYHISGTRDDCKDPDRTVASPRASAWGSEKRLASCTRWVPATSLGRKWLSAGEHLELEAEREALVRL